MALKIYWTKRAEKTFDKVIVYLLKEWSEKEVKNFVRKTNNVIEHISEKPKMFPTSKKVNIHKALITRHNSLLFKIKGSNQIDLLFFCDNRQNPKKLKV
jgi:plasmid stabilization system protein ParE